MSVGVRALPKALDDVLRETTMASRMPIALAPPVSLFPAVETRALAYHQPDWPQAPRAGLL